MYRNKNLGISLIILINLLIKRNVSYVIQAKNDIENQIIRNFTDSNYPDSCSSQIYCNGSLLHIVQTSNMYADSKTFVDMPLVHNPEKTINDFNILLETNNFALNDTQVKQFVNSYFKKPGDELVSWIPTDWKENPIFLNSIRNQKLRQWGKELNDIWHSLGRKMKDEVKKNPELYSILPIDNPFIIPGGRFREIYYWDSYWIILGILHCEMFSTAKGILNNFLSFINIYGFIPNGGRVYYLKRSQPPLLTKMLKHYVDYTGDNEFAIQSVPLLEKEFYYFWNNYIHDIQGHKLAAYGGIHSNGPRPESYKEDLKNSEKFNTDYEKFIFFNHMKAGAESGMDFSSRFFIKSDDGSPYGQLIDIKAGDIIPVELNAFLYGNAKIIAEFYEMAGNKLKQIEFEEKANEILNGIEAILWDDKIGVWLDWDIKNNQRRNFFTVTNLSPLWTKAYNQSNSELISKKILNYLKLTKVDKYPGGVPNTLYHSSEQWDLPNVWPPMQHMLIIGLDNLGTKESKNLGEKWATRWVQSNYAAYLDRKLMYEKYNAEEFGGHGGGGEYEIQTGFGWSNGVIIDLLAKYGDILKSGATSFGKCFTSTTMASMILFLTLFGR